MATKVSKSADGTFTDLDTSDEKIPHRLTATANTTPALERFTLIGGAKGRGEVHVLISCMDVVVRRYIGPRSPMYAERRDGACRVFFTDQADTACTKRGRGDGTTLRPFEKPLGITECVEHMLILAQ